MRPELPRQIRRSARIETRLPRCQLTGIIGCSGPETSSASLRLRLALVSLKTPDLYRFRQEGSFRHAFGTRRVGTLGAPGGLSSDPW